MREFEVTFPTLLMQLHQLEFDYDDGEGIDFEPYHEFQPAKDTADWIKAWTGNHELTAAEYRIFGQDGSGGYAAFWLVRDGKPILEQPIVFFGSEGEATCSRLRGRESCAMTRCSKFPWTTSCSTISSRSRPVISS